MNKVYDYWNIKLQMVDELSKIVNRKSYKTIIERINTSRLVVPQPGEPNILYVDERGDFVRTPQNSINEIIHVYGFDISKKIGSKLNKKLKSQFDYYKAGKGLIISHWVPGFWSIYYPRNKKILEANYHHLVRFGKKIYTMTGSSVGVVEPENLLNYFDDNSDVSNVAKTLEELNENRLALLREEPKLEDRLLEEMKKISLKDISRIIKGKPEEESN